MDEPDYTSFNFDFNLDCAMASLTGKPCATSVHDAAVAVDASPVVTTPVDVQVIVEPTDMQPIADASVIVGLELSVAILTSVFMWKAMSR